MTPTQPAPVRSRPVPANPVAVVLLGVLAASLAVMSVLHLAGTLGGGSAPYRASAAGIAEAVICVVLAATVIGAVRAPERSRPLALGATGFAILGFLVGLNFTVRGGSVVDLTYHATGLALLLAALTLLLRRRSPSTG